MKLELSSYATKTDLKNVTHDTSKTNLASLKTEVGKIDVDKLKTFPVDLAKLSNLVKKKPNTKKMDQILKRKSVM